MNIIEGRKESADKVDLSEAIYIQRENKTKYKCGVGYKCKFYSNLEQNGWKCQSVQLSEEPNTA